MWGSILNSLLVESRTSHRKVASSNPGLSGGRIFFSSRLSVLTLIRCPFHPRVTIVARKRPRPFCQKCRWQVTPKYAYTLDQRSRSGLTMLMCRHSVGTYPETSSRATCQGTPPPPPFFLASHLSLAGNSGRLARVKLQQPQEHRYPFLTLNSACCIFVCPNKGVAANAWDL